MATNYDAPRKTDEELSEDSLEELKARRAEKNSGAVDGRDRGCLRASSSPGRTSPAKS